MSNRGTGKQILQTQDSPFLPSMHEGAEHSCHHKKLFETLSDCWTRFGTKKSHLNGLSLNRHSSRNTGYSGVHRFLVTQHKPRQCCNYTTKLFEVGGDFVFMAFARSCRCFRRHNLKNGLSSNHVTLFRLTKKTTQNKHEMRKIRMKALISGSYLWRLIWKADVSPDLHGKWRLPLKHVLPSAKVQSASQSQSHTDGGSDAERWRQPGSAGAMWATTACRPVNVYSMMIWDGLGWPEMA